MYKNTLLNVLGMLVPGIILIPIMAYLSRMLDVELFGIYMLVLSILGYGSLFDAGITRAVIRKIAISKNIDTDRTVMGTAIIAVSILSFLAMMMFYYFSSSITILLNVSSDVFNDVKISIELLSITMPFFLVGTVSFSYIEGKQYFLELNKNKITTGVILVIMPAFFVYFNQSLVSAILGLLFARILVAFIAFHSCNKYLGKNWLRFNLSTFKSLVMFGGWITVSNIVSPVMSYFDRFILSNLLGADKVAYFVAPKELIQKLTILPTAVSKTIFPYFSSNHNKINEKRTELYIFLICILLFVLIPLFYFSKEILTLWLGSEYGIQSYQILQILIIGFFFNSIAQIPFVKIQAIGRSKVTAMLHLGELFPFLLVLYILVILDGFKGAAIAWTIRVIIDYLILEFLSRKMGR